MAPSASVAGGDRAATGAGVGACGGDSDVGAGTAVGAVGGADAAGFAADGAGVVAAAGRNFPARAAPGFTPPKASAPACATPPMPTPTMSSTQIPIAHAQRPNLGMSVDRSIILLAAICNTPPIENDRATVQFDGQVPARPLGRCLQRELASFVRLAHRRTRRPCRGHDSDVAIGSLP